jgi:hypothetical protein
MVENAGRFHWENGTAVLHIFGRCSFPGKPLRAGSDAEVLANQDIIRPPNIARSPYPHNRVGAKERLIDDGGDEAGHR